MEEEPIVNAEPVIEVPETAEVVTPEVPPGAKTDSVALLESLQKEREKRRELEAQLQELKSAPETGEIVSDEGKALLKKIATLEEKLSSKDKQEMLGTIFTQYPVLKDKTPEFEQFCEENPGMKLETAAKAFLVEKDLFVPAQPRKGLEKATGGGRTPPSTGMTIQEVDELRTTNYRKYSEMVRKGQIKF